MEGAVNTKSPDTDVTSGSVHVRYFAAARDLAGCAEEQVELAPGEHTAASVMTRIAVLHPALAPHLARLRVALNGEFADLSARVVAGDELALMPPVAGGAPEADEGAPGTGAPEPGTGEPAPATGERSPAERVVRAEILDVPLVLECCVRDVSHAGAGGVVSFLGLVRDHADGAPVVRLDYEAYVDLATVELRRVLEQVAAQHVGAWLSAQHRVGQLSVGDVAVVVVASAPHRGEAFEACRAAIDRLKETVPIWKKEWAPGGAAAWVNFG